MSTSGFVIAGDNVQAASILLSRFSYSFQGFHPPFKVPLLSCTLLLKICCDQKQLSKDKNKIKTQESERGEKDSGRAGEVERVWDPGGKLLCLHVCLLWKRFSSHIIIF